MEITFQHLIQYAYSGVTIYSLMGYLPQIRKLLLCSRTPKNMALSSWVVWSVGSFISLVYIMCIVKNNIMVLATSCYLLCNLTVCFLILYKTYWRKSKHISLLEAIVLPVSPHVNG